MCWLDLKSTGQPFEVLVTLTTAYQCALNPGISLKYGFTRIEILHIIWLSTGYEFETRVQEIEVKVDGVYNTQQLILDRLKRLESSTGFGMLPVQTVFQHRPIVSYLPPTNSYINMTIQLHQWQLQVTFISNK